MNLCIRSILAGVFALSVSLFAGTASAQQEGKELNFGFINTDSSLVMKNIWQPLLDDMEKETGLKVKAFFASDYAGIVTGMQYNKVQLAYYGNKSAMEAVDRADGEIFAQTVNAEGAGGYYSHLIAHKDSPLNSEKDVLAQAKNLTFGNGDPNSTSGFLVPGYYVFAINKLEPKTIFKRTLNANHEANALSVANKQVDVATCNNEVLKRLGEMQPEKRAQIKIIWTSPLIASDPLVWRKDLSTDIKNKVRNFMLSYGQDGRPNAAREREVLKGLHYSGFRVSTNDQLLPIRQLELFKERGTIEGNANINAADKAAKIKEIDAKLADLNLRMSKLAQAKP
ncbi:MAG: phosphonate ABC transporter substrate-binding protein [Zoogloeaceae bacterium]|jgi:phosphonate transport system substrate-binding protein|nr:phosphonate ABC transporter substrate-binding protein [Zoogloeaceae bacterium]